jgi:hypothetical protein
VSEIAVLVLGLALSMALAVPAALFASSDLVGLITFVLGLLLTVAGFGTLLRKHRAKKLAYDVAGWYLRQAEHQRYPRRSKYKRLLLRTLVWVPSLIASVVLFFLPIASHALYPSSHYLRYYRIPIPWTLTVVSFRAPGEYHLVAALASGRRRYGVTPFWERESLSAIMTFGSIGSASDWTSYEVSREETTGSLLKEFRLGDVPLLCRQESWPSGQRLFTVLCQTPKDVRLYNFNASFKGHDGDLALFYEIIKGVKPVRN